MASGTWTLAGRDQFGRTPEQEILTILTNLIPDLEYKKEEYLMSTIDEKTDDTYINTPDAGDDFDFVMAYDDDPAEMDERLLPDGISRGQPPSARPRRRGHRLAGQHAAATERTRARASDPAARLGGPWPNPLHGRQSCR